MTEIGGPILAFSRSKISLRVRKGSLLGQTCDDILVIFMTAVWF